MAFEISFLNDLIEYLKQKFACNSKFCKRDIKIDIVTIVGKLHSNRRVSVVVPVCSMADGSNF
jgi:hypothetical protein